MKKTLSVILALALFVSCFAMMGTVVFADGDTDDKWTVLLNEDFESQEEGSITSTKANTSCGSNTNITERAVVDKGGNKVLKFATKAGWVSPQWDLKSAIKDFVDANAEATDFEISFSIDANFTQIGETAKPRFLYRKDDPNKTVGLMQTGTPGTQTTKFSATKKYSAEEAATLISEGCAISFDNMGDASADNPVIAELDNVLVKIRAYNTETVTGRKITLNSNGWTHGGSNKINGDIPAGEHVYNIPVYNLSDKDIPLNFMLQGGSDNYRYLTSPNIAFETFASGVRKTVPAHGKANFMVYLNVAKGNMIENVTPSNELAQTIDLSSLRLRLNYDKSFANNAIVIGNTGTPLDELWALSSEMVTGSRIEVAVKEEEYNGEISEKMLTKISCSQSTNTFYYTHIGKNSPTDQGVFNNDDIQANTTYDFDIPIYNPYDVDLPISVYFQNIWSGFDYAVGSVFDTRAGSYITVPAHQSHIFSIKLKFNEEKNVVVTDKEGKPTGVLISPENLALRIDVKGDAARNIYVGDCGDMINKFIKKSSSTDPANAVIKTAIPEVEEKVLYNGNAEDGITNWMKFSASYAKAKVEQVIGGANGTEHSIKFTPDNYKYDSIGFDLAPAIIDAPELGFNGGGTGRYVISFYAKAEAGKGGKFMPTLNSQKHMSQTQINNNIAGTYWPTVKCQTYIQAGTSGNITMTDEWKKFTAIVDVPQEFITVITKLYAEKRNTDAAQLILRLDGSGEGRAYETERFPYYVDEVTIRKADLTGASVTLTDKFSINFAAKTSEVKGLTGAYIQVGANQYYVNESLTNDTYTYFTYDGILPQNIGKDVKATLHYTLGGTDCTGGEITYSVKQYCYKQLNKQTGKTNLSTLLVDLLNYCTEAQKYLKVDPPAEYVNADLTDIQAAWGTSETPALADNTRVSETGALKGKEDKLALTDFGLVLDNSVQFIIIGDSAKLLVSDGQGNPLKTPETIDGGYLYNVPAANYRSQYFFTLYNGDEIASDSYVFSVESYAALMKDDPTVGALVVALMKFGDSAAKFA